MKVPGKAFALGLLCVTLGAGPADAETAARVLVERFEIRGPLPFVDEFTDGSREAAPTSRFVDRGQTTAGEADGALRLGDDDGVDADLGGDLVVLDRPLLEGDGLATAEVTFRGTQGGETRVLTLLLRVSGESPMQAPRIDLAVTRDVGRSAPAQPMPWDPKGFLGPLPVRDRPNPFLPFPDAAAGPSRCGGESGAWKVVLGGFCDVLPAGAENAVVTLRLSHALPSGTVRAAYRLGEGDFVPAEDWEVPAPPSGILLPPATSTTPDS